MNIPPWIYEPFDWISVRQFSIYMGRSLRWGQWQCQDGILADFGIATYQDLSGRWFVRYREP